ncbi:hypothetical protein [Brevundimonas variabilis]|uniref:Uncharacterized protein n=1 Tax=Brevundimonas variabilis TaxID=74312 RepID=A0A7W9CJZ9_9CAUL|nr:hypothetical protein [Brevundimonas variabilis]MBB5747098.1 hypothetical protein [Brevundimonas variabilis]
MSSLPSNRLKFGALAIGLAIVSHFALPDEARASPNDAQVIVELCEKMVLDSGGFVAEADQAWNVDLVLPNGGALYYMGTTHPSDASSLEYDEIIAAYRRFDPTAVFFEGCCEVRTKSEADARAIHETALVQFLAKLDGVAPISLEPSDISLRLALLAEYSALDVQLFYLLRDIAQERERRDAQGEVLRRRAQWYLDKLLDMPGPLPDWPLKSLEDVDNAVQVRWPSASWQTIPLNWFTPYVNSDSAGPLLFHQINRLENKYRNATMYRHLASAALRGERVFAAVGRSHVALQADALQCALGNQVG